MKKAPKRVWTSHLTFVLTALRAVHSKHFQNKQ